MRKGLRVAISIAALGLGMAGLAPGLSPALAAGAPCGVPGDTIRKGANAYADGRYELAMPMFDCVLRSDDALSRLHAEYYLARIYSDDAGGFVDHAKAYTLYLGISDAADVVDPEDARRAPFVAKAVTAIAGYVRRGLPEIGLKSDLGRAVEYYRNAATFFNEPDAQFELAKLHLAGTGVPVDVRLGLHYIQNLVREGHAGAQAYLADQHWRGGLEPAVSKDRPRALAMSKLAVENASMSDRLWIEDIYQNIYCGTKSAERVQAAMIVNDLRRAYARNPNASQAPQAQKSIAPAMALGRHQPTPSRTCSNGEPIMLELRTDIATPPLASSLSQSLPQQTTPAGMRPPAR